jgi:DNA repair exonuclease SbcCD nuclease subunit
LEVLQRVHRLAQQRGPTTTGVLFLGDFWHIRGTLRVDCLNAVLAELRTWTVPMILIPGNHDQVTLGGHSHGLTPLEQSYRVTITHNSTMGSTTTTTTIPGPLVISHPTKLANALLVPHIRDLAIMESVLQSPLAYSSQALFVHADVTGAYMNDMIVSTGGVHPSVFPPHKPIYSGHFHKPHTVTHNHNTICIEYLGSPYETSLAEAQQAKAIVVLDATQGWKCIERIPIDIGRKHYKPGSLQELLDLHVVTDNNNNNNNNNNKRVMEGDRIVLTLSRKEFLDDLDNNAVVQDHIRHLRKHGVAVEIREAPPEVETTAMTTAATTLALEDLSPGSIWDRFAKEQVNRGVWEQEEATRLHAAGLQILEELESDNNSSKASDSGMLATPTNLQFDSVSVEGYGPFPNRVQYPLNDRGLVLLRGLNLDGGSDR